MYDPKYFEKKIIPILASFYFLAYLPELVLKNHKEHKPILDLTKELDKDYIKKFLENIIKPL